MALLTKRKCKYFQNRVDMDLQQINNRLDFFTKNGNENAYK